MGPSTLHRDRRSRTALGAGELIATLSASNNSVNLDGGVSNPMYDVTHQDTRTTGGLSWQRSFDNSEYEVGGHSRRESFNFLDPSGAFPGLGQTISSYYARGSFGASAKLHVSGGAYISHYSTFGGNIDGRFGLVYDADQSTTVRASWGTGFRAPLLIERYVFPLDQLPPPDANCVIAGQGNPNEVPEHATEYEVGLSPTTSYISHPSRSSTRPSASRYRMGWISRSPGPICSTARWAHTQSSVSTSRIAGSRRITVAQPSSAACRLICSGSNRWDSVSS